MTTTARIFLSGSSQAVRLPKAFHVESDEVLIRHHGQQVILEPIEQGWDWLDRLNGVPDDFFQAVLSAKNEPAQERD